jgi:hypothetical protein
MPADRPLATIAGDEKPRDRMGLSSPAIVVSAPPLRGGVRRVVVGACAPDLGAPVPRWF